MSAPAAALLRGITRNSAFLAAGQLASRTIGFLYVLVLARFLGVEDFGVYNLVLSLALVTVTAVEFGLGRLAVRDLASAPERIPAYIATLIPLRAFLAIAGYLALLAFCWLAYPGRVLTLTALAALSLLPMTVALTCDALFQARQTMHLSAAGDVVLTLVNCLLGTAALLAGGGLPHVLAASVVASLAYMAYMAFMARAGGLAPLGRFDLRFAARLTRLAVPFAVVTVLGALAMRTELLLLGLLASTAEVGLYSAAAKLPEALLLLPAVLATAAGPVLAQQQHAASPQLRQVYLWSLRRLLAFTLPVALAGVVLAEPALRLLFPPAFVEASFVMRLLFCAYPLASCQMLNSAVLVASRRPALMLLNALGSVALQLGLGIVLIGPFGLVGAGLAVIASQLLSLCLSSWCIRRLLRLL